CGLTDPPQDPDERLLVRALSPASIVTEELFAAPPDSGGTGTLTHLRFTLPPSAIQALGQGAVLEAVMRIPSGSASLEGWSEGTAAWIPLQGVFSTEGNDMWWLEGWTDQLIGNDLVAADGSVRLRTDTGSEATRSFLRVVEPAAGLWVRAAAAEALTHSGGDLAILASGVVRHWSTGGAELSQAATSNAPLNLCRVSNDFYGTTTTEIRTVGIAGGNWQRLISLPWSGGNATLTSDGSDLFLLRYPGTSMGDTFPTLLQVEPGMLVSTRNLDAATEETSILRRNGMPVVTGGGLAWWGRERMLAAPGTQEGVFGLVAFSKAARALRFIPLPFEPGGISIAFVGSYLFVGNARPSLQSLGWSSSPAPELPPPVLLYRWPSP
ncbi:MAG: hypothetical protein V3U45_00900, partial [bacterium]